MEIGTDGRNEIDEVPPTMLLDKETEEVANTQFEERKRYICSIFYLALNQHN